LVVRGQVIRICMKIARGVVVVLEIFGGKKYSGFLSLWVGVVFFEGEGGVFGGKGEEASWAKRDTAEGT
jgi:hypothetical protein